MKTTPLIAIVGTTGVGKTSLARALAGVATKVAKFFDFLCPLCDSCAHKGIA